ncbi:sporulation-specific protein 75 [Yamadazyma tenuis]|nr:sporulation-specific protein 75 [Yamadazyma tenuis]
MGVFYSPKFQQFLNTTQTGLAHSSSGAELSLLTRSLCTSLSLCIIQLAMFCFFRNIFKSLYQPRSYFVPQDERVEPAESGFLNWVIPTLSTNIDYYLCLGLDTYFFVRYISMMLLFFLVVGALNIVVLVPINTSGSSSEFKASGLDRLSLSNISSSKVHLLNGHFIMSLMTIGFFHLMIVYEMESVIKIRKSYLSSKRHRSSVVSKILLITHIPTELLDIERLKSELSIIPGGVKNIWFLSDYKKINVSVREAKEAVYELEVGEIKFIKKYHKKVGNNRYKHYTVMRQLKPKFYPPISINTKLPFGNISLNINIPGLLRFFIFQKKVDQIDWSVERIKKAKKAIEKEKVLLASEQLKKFNTVFVQFNTQSGAYTAHQVLLSQSQGCMDKTVIEVHPRDVQWNNLTKENSATLLVQRYLVTLLCICLIMLYIIPVSFIGLISQVPLLTKLLPFLGWVYSLPEEVRNCFSSILPSLFLSILTSVMMITFRFLTYYKGKLTGAEIEIDLQRWYFSFLFIQQFLVVTISSSITVIFKQIVDQPTSIPVMLATNLPKAATFFYKFIAVRALSFCGNNFLRIDQLILRNTFYKLWDKTPRQKLVRETTLLPIKWGTTYPIYSVYAAIGLTYTIISPLISVFVVLILFLVLTYYKYSLRYIYSHINESETYGRLYPSALLHLYAGIYCLECCMIGVFFLSKDASGNFPMNSHGWIMSLILLMTVFGNTTLYNRYHRYFSYLPIINDREYPDDPLGTDLSSNYQMLYLHPNFKYEIPRVWLPSDDLEVAHTEARHLEDNEGIESIVIPGSTIKFGWRNRFSEIVVRQGPPDFK